MQLKFFLHVSQEKQRKRLLTRLDDPNKTWKFDQNDLTERAHWADYTAAFEAAIAGTAAPHAPWYVIPANNKWFTHLIAVDAMVAALELLDLKLPKPSADVTAQIADFQGATGREVEAKVVMARSACDKAIQGHTCGGYPGLLRR